MNETPIRLAARDIARFISKVEVGEPYACWEWQGTLTSRGYGQMYVRGKMLGAHRIAYSFTKGAILPGMQIDHLCWNRKCVNPDHLRMATNSMNQLNRRPKTAS